MKRTFATATIAVAAFCLGALSVQYLHRPFIPKGWMSVVPDGSSAFFDMDAMKTDIPPPQPGTLGGHVKFLQRDKGIEIGYVLKLPIKANPVSALPPKYRHEIKLANGFTIGPPDQVSYTGKFTFNLQDGDGFSLAKIMGPEEQLVSGSDNQLQGVTQATVPESVAADTKRIAVSFEATKCDPCD